jgi:MFS family permease
MYIGLLGSCYYAGFSIGSIFLVRFADIYGRRPVYITGLAIHSFSYIVMMFSPYLYLNYAMLFLCGLAATMRASVGYMYGLEFIVSQNQYIVGSLMHLMDGVTTILISLYFWHISKEYIYFHLITMTFCVIITIVVALYFVESPKFLIAVEN